MKKMATAKLTASMIVFGTIGLVIRYAPLPSAFIAMIRGFVGAAFLAAVVLISRRGFDFKAIKKNLILLAASGACIGFNWILLFESYRYTTVATATLCYYMAPIIVIAASPIVLGEKITLKKGLCALGAVIGMFFISGVFETGFGSISEIAGILLGLGAACLYATVMLLNKKMKNISAYDMTVPQLFFAALAIMPYSLIVDDVAISDFTPLVIFILFVLGVVHTGITYAMFFGAVRDINAQTSAILSYLDPIIAILLSAFVLKEQMTLFGIIGAVFIIASALISEINIVKRNDNTQE
jgi:RarD protein